MNTPLTLSTSRSRAGEPTLTAVGEIDLSNVGEFNAALDAAMTTDSRLTVDLTGVEYLDSAALACLFAHVDDVRITANPLLESVLRISGLADMAPVTIAEPAAGD
ncbi:STAS domain-containing protein [Planosporangium sp. 12N6]|uniref:STAS domain-containing protein n=1 Tax=Planosporangium spinosum TaxID=3402278 RepID=UPI003CF4C35A